MLESSTLILNGMPFPWPGAPRWWAESPQGPSRPPALGHMMRGKGLAPDSSGGKSLGPRMSLDFRARQMDSLQGLLTGHGQCLWAPPNLGQHLI